MAEEENVAAASTEATAEAQVETAEGVETAAAPELTLTEKVAATEGVETDEASDAAKFAALDARVAALETANEELAARVAALEGSTPIELDTEVKALVAKMHEKMKLLIPMD